ncbi:bZIP transcription factor TGA10-like isoform X1 [Lycium barbarum]|uniref:bZIP transcription factor TGA10-like isoform X1 n=1 Tax=Lycium barbarum TaxID=112863 RepID=UPI00293E1EC7|nr:bZIP transcription factor TGA10-like isoform X1 [Lycium barbarum]
MGFEGSFLEQKNNLFVGVGVHFMAYSNKSNDPLQSNNSQISFSHHHQLFHSSQQQLDHQMENNQMSFGLLQQSTSSSSANPENFISKENSGAYDLGELDDQALFLYLDGQEPSSIKDQKLNSGMRPPTLNIFPSQPMHIEPSSTKGNNGLVSSGSKKSSQPSMAKTDVPTAASGPEPPKTANKREGNRKGPTSCSEQDAPKTPDPKTLRRLAQNREAARKSRLRKKAYVQQLESSRIRLAQLEQEIQRARSQGFHVGGNALLGGDQGFQLNMANISSDAAVFDLEYARWLEEHHRLMCELRNAVHDQEHLPEDQLGIYVENCVTHYDEMMNLKGMLAKTDVFHLVSGLYKSPAERCFLWIGDFRPSELLRIILNQIEPLTENQVLGICGLQQSTQEAEDALSQGLEALNQSLSDTIASDALLANCPQNMGNYMGQMALAINKLSTVEAFLRQAENLRHQMIHRLHQILTTHQAARCFLAIGEYFHRLRALSSLWLARPRQE